MNLLRILKINLSVHFKTVIRMGEKGAYVPYIEIIFGIGQFSNEKRLEVFTGCGLIDECSWIDMRVNRWRK